jgi:hypothetical protein
MPTDEGNTGIQAAKGARNQALWGEVNERIRAVAETSAAVQFLCECVSLDCTEVLNLSLAEYECIRSSPARFPIIPGHEFPEFERIVEENEDYLVVEKFGEAAEVAKSLDPRSHARQRVSARMKRAARRRAARLSTCGERCATGEAGARASQGRASSS